MRLLRYILPIVILIFAPSWSTAMTIDDVPNVHVASRTQYVSNPSDILSAQAVTTLNEMIGKSWRDTSTELVVVAVDKVDDMSPGEFATELFEKWGIGKSDKDNGILFLISRDDREAHIRTGYGAEGALPDIIASRILRDKVYPRFREGDFDGGITDGTSAIIAVLNDPAVRDELMSSQPSDARSSDDDDTGEVLFNLYLTFAGLIGALMLVYVIYMIAVTRRMDDTERWNRLNRLWLVYAIGAFMTLGCGVPAFGLLVYKMHRIRRHRRNCPHCGTRMQLIDEVHDNDYLTPTQDLEEKLDSVDYDVWHCPKCAQTDIYPYLNRTSRYTECPRCHARTMSHSERRILRDSTTRREGEGVDIYYCRNCGDHSERRFVIPRKEDTSGLGAAAAGAVLGSMLGGRGGGGGGFSGGSFGGGHTGGGGAGGSW